MLPRGLRIHPPHPQHLFGVVDARLFDRPHEEPPHALADPLLALHEEIVDRSQRLEDLATKAGLFFHLAHGGLARRLPLLEMALGKGPKNLALEILDFHQQEVFAARDHASRRILEFRGDLWAHALTSSSVLNFSASSNALATANIVGSAKGLAMSWTPIGKPAEVMPQGIDIPACPEILQGIVNTSDRYIWIGSADFSPNLKAAEGEVGVRMTSTCLKASSKSRVMSARTFCACPE